MSGLAGGKRRHLLFDEPYAAVFGEVLQDTTAKSRRVKKNAGRRPRSAAPSWAERPGEIKAQGAQRAVLGAELVGFRVVRVANE